MARAQRRSNQQVPGRHELSRFRRRLLRWFDANGRRFPWRKLSISKYQAVMAEVLLQRTRAETVADFFPRFIVEFPSWKRLSSANEACVQRCLQPIGLWRRRAASIQTLAREMAKRNGRFPSNREDVEALPGVGQYIANAIMLLCHGKARPLLDVNMARVLERVFGPRELADIRYDPDLQELARKVVQCKSPAQLNWAILDLASAVCVTKNPRCDDCPLTPMCLTAEAE